MSQPSLTNFIVKRPWLKRWMTPLANWYTDAAGYRKLGLRADDLIPEESETVLLALKRLPPKEAYDRVFRMRRAFQCSISHQLLPKNEQTKPEEVRPTTLPSSFRSTLLGELESQLLTYTQDVPYLSPIIKEIESERRERMDLDAMVIKK
ncbi:ubiquinol-cytochrome c reductase complex 14 kDa protein [Aureobasidium sp. EXF-10727]|nr:ubiquinol-cytochrome c reductase complex 14 kDa protein [Aureobasidium sp. EXF-10727]